MNAPDREIENALLRPLVSPLPAWVPDILRLGADVLEVRRGDFLFRSGNPVTRMYYVVSGEIRLVEYAATGTECTLQRAGPGEWIGECSTCVETYSCYARPARRSRVVGLPMALFKAVLNEDLVFANAWALQLAHSLRRTFARYERRSLKTARERLLHFVVTESRGRPCLELPQSFAALAGELGLTRESLYRTLALLERDGIVRREGRCLAVLAAPPAPVRLGAVNERPRLSRAPGGAAARSA